MQQNSTPTVEEENLGIQPEHPQVYRTAELTVMPGLGQVQVADKIVRLGPVNMAVLCTLIQRAERVVSRAELFDRVWPNQIVNDDVLTRSIADIRKEVGQYCKTPIIETIPKKGYRWLSPWVEKEQVKPSNAMVMKQFLLWPALVVVVAVTVALILNSVITTMLKADAIAIAFIPIRFDSEIDKSLAIEIETSVRDSLSRQNNLRFIAKAALEHVGNKPITYLADEFSTQWLIEGEIRRQRSDIYIELSLVDARTALVEYAVHDTVLSASNKWQVIVDQFVKNSTSFISPD